MKSNTNMSTKRKLYNSCILPGLTYGCETWTLTNTNLKKLLVCQRSMERHMLGVRLKDKVRCTTLRQITKIEDIIKKVKTMKWRWAGHMMRENNEKWSKMVTFWYPRGEVRKRGRQCIRWEDELRMLAGINWYKTARERTLWKKLEEAFVARHTK